MRTIFFATLLTACVWLIHNVYNFWLAWILLTVIFGTATFSLFFFGKGKVHLSMALHVVFALSSTVYFVLSGIAAIVVLGWLKGVLAVLVGAAGVAYGVYEFVRFSKSE
jgi:uncharacterized membrane protein